MKKEELSEKLKKSKEKLQLHMEKFNSLREKGKSREALEELKIALNFAAQTLEYSNSVLHQLHIDFVSMPEKAKQDTLKKIEAGFSRSSRICSESPALNIHIPPKKTIH